jgi:transposase
MLGKNQSQPALFQVVDIEALVPPNHRLRKIDAVLDLSFVHEAVAECYSAGRGRPSIDPELALRMMLLGRLYNLGDRELCDEIGMHVGMRWFCRLNLEDPVPDHSTLSRLKNERWSRSGLFQRVFDEVVRQCAEAGLVSGRHVSVDGSEVRANASMKSLQPIEAPVLRSADDEPEPGAGAAKEPQPKGGWTGHGVKYGNQTHRSTSDPEARLYRKGKAKEAKLCYVMHDLIDTKSRVILSRKVSEAHSSAERRVCIEMLDEVLAKKAALCLPNQPGVASLDAGYGTGECAAALLDRGVLPHMPLQAGEKMEEIPTWKRRTLDLMQHRKRREKVRVARARNRVRELQQTRGYQVSRKLRVRSEHTFAEAKGCHGMDRARSRGQRRVQVEAELTGVVQNLKRLASYRGRKQPMAARAALTSESRPLHRATRPACRRAHQPIGRPAGRHRWLPGRKLVRRLLAIRLSSTGF